MEKVILTGGFFAKTFPVTKADASRLCTQILPKEVGEVSDIIPV